METDNEENPLNRKGCICSSLVADVSRFWLVTEEAQG